MIVSVCMLIFTVAERPWKDPEVNTLAIANEFFFYALLVLALACSCIHQTDSQVSERMGYVMLLVFTLAIHVNLVALLAQACYFTKLLYLRKKQIKLNREASNHLLAEKQNKETPGKEIDDDDEKSSEKESSADKVIPVIYEVNSILESDGKESSVALSKLITPEEEESPAVVAAADSNSNSHSFDPEYLLQAEQPAYTLPQQDGRTTQEA